MPILRSGESPIPITIPVGDTLVIVASSASTAYHFALGNPATA